MDRLKWAIALVFGSASFVAFELPTSAQDDQRSVEVFRFRIHCDHDPLEVEQSKVSVRLDGGRRRKIDINFDGREYGQLELERGDALTLFVEHPSLFVVPPSHSLSAKHPQREIPEFALSRVGTVRGKVFDAESGEGVVGVTVHVIDPKSHYVIARETTDQFGEYAIECPAIDLLVTIDSRSEWEIIDTPLKIRVVPETENELLPLAVSLTPGITGQVIGSDGQPAPRVLVGHQWKGELGLTDQAGRFSISPASFSQRNEAIFAVDFASGSVGVITATRESVDLEIQMHPARSASGIVVDGEQKPVAHVPVQLWMEIREGRRRYSYRQAVVYSDDAGKFEFTGMVPDLTYRATVSSTRRGGGAASIRGDDPDGFGSLAYDPATRIPTKSERQEDLIVSTSPLPELACATWHHSPPLTVKELRGKVIVLNFWGTWCGPCKRDFPTLRMLHDQFSDRGLVVVGIHTDHHYDPRDVKEDMEQYGLSYPIAIDAPGGTTAKSYGVNSYPTTLVIGRDGRLRPRMPRAQLLTEIQHELNTD